MMKLYYRLWSLILNVRFGYLRKRQIALFRGVSLFVNGKQIPNCKPIHIGRNVWIGRNVTILKGVAIGDNAVIASNSLVNTEVPANQLWAGIPARKIKENVSWEF